MRKLFWSRYLRNLLVFSLVGVFIVCGLNILIDPYSIIGTPPIKHLSQQKPELRVQLPAAKAAALRRNRYRGLILGTSRAMIGLDPKHLCWEASPVYNLGLEGPNIYEIRRYFEHASSTNNLKQVVFGLDFFSFNKNYSVKPVFSEARLARSRSDWVAHYPYLPDIFGALISVDSFMASFRTIAKQSNAAVFREDGLRIRGWLRPQADNNNFHMQMFFKKQLRRMVDLQWLPAPQRQYALSDEHHYSETLNDLRMLLERSHDDAIEMRLFISPVHAQILETFYRLGLIEEYKTWLRTVVKLNELVAGDKGRRPYPIWDFSGYNSITTEPVPGPGQIPAEMQWYFDASHFSRSVGDMILDRVLGCKTQEALHKDFGNKISMSNIEQHLIKFDNAAKEYQSKHEFFGVIDDWPVPQSD